jgi:hypothetical protein
MKRLIGIAGVLLIVIIGGVWLTEVYRSRKLPGHDVSDRVQHIERGK